MLPNSPNVLMAAERAAELSDKQRPRRPDALAAGRAWPPRSRWTRRAAPPRTPRRCSRRSRRVRTGAVTGAARDDAEERPARFHRGDAVGFVDEQLVAWGEPAETLEAVLGELGARGRAGHADRRRRRAARRRRRRRARPDGRRARVLLGRPAGLLVADRGRVAPRAVAADAADRAPRRSIARVLTPPLAFASSAPLGADELRARRRPAAAAAVALAAPLERRRPRRPRRAPSGSGC